MSYSVRRISWYRSTWSPTPPLHRSRESSEWQAIFRYSKGNPVKGMLHKISKFYSILKAVYSCLLLINVNFPNFPNNNTSNRMLLAAIFNNGQPTPMFLPTPALPPIIITTAVICWVLKGFPVGLRLQTKLKSTHKWPRHFKLASQRVRPVNYFTQSTTYPRGISWIRSQPSYETFE